MNVIVNSLILQVAALFFSIAVAKASETTALIIQEKIHDQVSIHRFPISEESPSYNSYEIWRSAKGISCSVALHRSATDQPNGTLECVSVSMYKAQISFSCSANRNLESGAYLFFGEVGDTGENKNFTVWCE